VVRKSILKHTRPPLPEEIHEQKRRLGLSNYVRNQRALKAAHPPAPSPKAIGRPSTKCEVHDFTMVPILGTGYFRAKCKRCGKYLMERARRKPGSKLLGRDIA
jgi:hypothetical protein